MVRLGQHLQQERQKRHLTIDQVAQATKIKPQFLSAIEKGEYHKLPSPAYAQGFVRNYVGFLGLSKAEMLAFFRREFDQERAYKVLPEGFTSKKEVSIKHIRIQQPITIVVGLVILIIGYLFFQFRGALFPPALQISSPKENAVVQQAVVVTGKTDSDATVLINNDIVTVDDSGHFSKTYSAFPGKTQITVIAKNRLGKEAIIKRDITVKE